MRVATPNNLLPNVKRSSLGIVPIDFKVVAMTSGKKRGFVNTVIVTEMRRSSRGI